jgi:hypothetical protein
VLHGVLNQLEVSLRKRDDEWIEGEKDRSEGKIQIAILRRSAIRAQIVEENICGEAKS